MSEPIPESIPTSADPRSKRPLKRRALTPVSEQATQIDTLFKDPSKPVHLPETSKPRSSNSLAPPPEIVANVQGSSAGAGSGEFHVYKASRRREYERMRLMDDELKKEKEDVSFERKREEIRKRDEEKTDKNRKRREKRKQAKNKKDTTAPTGQNEGASGKAAGSVRNGSNGHRAGPSIAVTDGDAMQDDIASSSAPGAAETPGVIIHDDD